MDFKMGRVSYKCKSEWRLSRFIIVQNGTILNNLPGFDVFICN